MSNIPEQNKKMQAATGINKDFCYSLSAAVVATIVGILLITHKVRIGLSRQTNQNTGRQITDKNMRQAKETNYWPSGIDKSRLTIDQKDHLLL